MMMHQQQHISPKLNISSRRPNKWLSSYILKAGSLSLILLVLVGGSAALLKQQRSDDSQQANGQAPSQPYSQHHQSASAANSYQNHQQQQPGSSSGASIAQQQQSPSPASAASYSSSSSVSISSSAPGVAGSPSQNSQAQVAASARGMDQLSSYASNYGNGPSSSSGANNQKHSSMSYGDSSAASANAPDQSYQAAANSVNLALANSGIFGSSSSSSGPSSSQAGGYSPSGASSGGQSSNSVQSLNPLHYFYYPSKEAGAGSGKAAAAGGVDMMSNSASNNYQSMASYPTYADQLNSALSSIGASGPEAAASSQDPSYLPQPSSNSMSAGSMGDMGSQNVGYSQQQANVQQVGGNQQQSPQHYSAADLNAYPSNLNSVGQQSPHQSSSNGISFNGPSSGGQAGSDFMSQHMGGGGGSGNAQQVPSMSAYTSNLYNQMGDLSTSNFGNNAGGMASVASYMAPNQQHSSSSPQTHDLFSSMGGAGSGPQFSSAASSLSPSAVSPPLMNQQQQQQQQQQQANTNSLFGQSLFGGVGQQSGQQASANSLYSSQPYLGPFMSAQQYNQLTGQQASQLDPSLTAAASGPQASVAASGSSSKRFGIGSFIMPMLALAGLSLLIPTMSNIGTAVGRKKRSIEDKASSSSRQQQIAFDPINGVSQLAKEMSIGEYMDKIERYYSIYKNAVENDDCLNRLICEFGDAVKDVTGKSAVVT